LRSGVRVPPGAHTLKKIQMYTRNLPEKLEVTKEGYEFAQKDFQGVAFFRKDGEKFWLKRAHTKYWPTLIERLTDKNWIIKSYLHGDDEEE
jgi:hypothetical protein